MFFHHCKCHSKSIGGVLKTYWQSDEMVNNDIQSQRNIKELSWQSEEVTGPKITCGNGQRPHFEALRLVSW